MTLAAKPEIFIHSLFRTGSTYLWSRFRTRPEAYCFYEPFHPELISIDPHRPDPWGREVRSTEQTHHPALEAGRFAEYLALLTSGQRGVPLFRKSFSFTDFCRLDDHPHQREYLEMLIHATGSRFPVLQFNRSAMRIAWFRRCWPDAFHIYLYRNPRHQYVSARTQFESHQQDVFLLMDILTAGLNRETPQFKALDQAVHLQAFPSSVHAQEESAYRAIMPAYSENERYLVFLYLWFSALAENVQSADLLLNIDRLSLDPEYRETLTRLLVRQGCGEIDFSDAQITRYPGLPVPDAESIESRARQLAFQRFSPAQLHRLQRRVEPDTLRLLDVSLETGQPPPQPLTILSVSERLEKASKLSECLHSALQGKNPRMESLYGLEKGLICLDGRFATTRRVRRIPAQPVASAVGGGMRSRGYGKQGGEPLPLVTVITVVLNDQNALKTTLDSIWEQGYPNLELIVVDGNSSDGTPEYLRSVENRIDVWVSEGDEGIFDAMNKGVKLSSGEWVIFLNAGDTFYLPLTVERVVGKIPVHAELVYGDTYFLGGDFHGVVRAWPLSQLWKTMVFTHQSLFTRRAYLLAHPFDTRYRICADFNLIFNAYMDGSHFFQVAEAIGCFAPGFSESRRVHMALERWRVVRRRHNRPRVHLFYLSLILRRWLSGIKRKLVK